MDKKMEKITKATFRDTQRQIDKLRERIGKIEKAERSFQTNWMIQVECRLDALEKKSAGPGGQKQPGTVELDLTLPEADIGGLHFNEQKVHAVFDLKEDGACYSRDILFNSVRDTDEGTGRDLLTEYLNTNALKQLFYLALCQKHPADFLYRMGIRRYTDIEVFLPKENLGVKKYNGVSWWYWLAGHSSGSAVHFASVHPNGIAHNLNATAVGGCAPAFCVADVRGADVS